MKSRLLNGTGHGKKLSAVDMKKVRGGWRYYPEVWICEGGGLPFECYYNSYDCENACGGGICWIIAVPCS